jgi:site-specific DNA recombinase
VVVCAYCRVSTDSRDQTNSYENQHSYFKREIQARGLQLYRIYADKGLTGTKLNNRPDFFRMLHDAGIDVKTVRTVRGDRRAKTKHTVYELSDREPLFDEIWIKNTSRFARNTLSYEIISLLRMKKVNIYFIEQNINTNDIGQDLLLKLMQIFDEQDSKDKSLKVITGMYETAKSGKVLTHPRIYGYKYNKETNSLTTIPHEAQVVKRIFEMYAQGIGVRRIIKALDEDGILTRNGKPFCVTSVRRILDNEKYAGLNNPLKHDFGTVFNKYSTPKIRSDYTVEESDKIEPIISKELFYKCREIKSKKINSENQIGIYHGSTKYSGLIVCKKCGGRYVANRDDGRRFYNCVNKKAVIKKCDAPNISEAKLDLYFDKVRKNLDMFINGQLKDSIRKLLYAASIKLNKINSDNQSEIIKMEKEIEEQRFVLSGYYELFATSKSGRDILKDHIEKTEQKIEHLEAKLDEIKRPQDEIIQEIIDIQDRIAGIESYMQTYRIQSDIGVLDQIDRIEIYAGDGGRPNIEAYLKINASVEQYLPSGLNDPPKDIDYNEVMRRISKITAET